MPYLDRAKRRESSERCKRKHRDRYREQDRLYRRAHPQSREYKREWMRRWRADKHRRINVMLKLWKRICA